MERRTGYLPSFDSDVARGYRGTEENCRMVAPRTPGKEAEIRNINNTTKCT